MEHLHHFSSVYVRDAASVERVNRIDASAPVEQGFDIAVLLPELEFLQPYLATGAEPNETGPILGVSVCSDASLRMADTETQETRETRLLTLLRYVASKADITIRFIVFNGHAQWGDTALTRRMESKLKGYAGTEVVPYDGNVGTTLQAINECKVLLGVRLHSCIFAYACQVPFAAVAYHPKVTDFCREIGLPEELIFPAEGPQIEDSGELVLSLLQNGYRAWSANLLPLVVAHEMAMKALSPLTSCQQDGI